MPTPANGVFTWSSGLNHSVVDSSGGYSFGPVDGSSDSYHTFTAPATGVWAIDMTISWYPASLADDSAAIPTLVEWVWKPSSANSSLCNYETAFADGPYSGPFLYNGTSAATLSSFTRLVVSMTQNDVVYLYGKWFITDTPSGYTAPAIGPGYTPGGATEIPTTTIAAQFLGSGTGTPVVSPLGVKSQGVTVVGAPTFIDFAAGAAVTPNATTPTIAEVLISPSSVFNGNVVQSAMGGIVTGANLGATFANPLTPGNYIIALWSSYTNSYSDASGYNRLLTQGEADDNLLVSYRLITPNMDQNQVCGIVPASTGMCALFEVSGLTGPPVVDVYSLTETTSTTSNTKATSNTTVPDLALVLSYATSTTPVVTPDPGWTLAQTTLNASGRAGWSGYQVNPGVANPVTVTTTFSVAANNEVILVTLKNATVPAMPLLFAGVPSGVANTGQVGYNTTTSPVSEYVYDGSVWQAVGGGGSSGLTVNPQSGTSYTLILTDNKSIIVMSNASANTVTVPTNASVAFPIGSTIAIEQAGAGKTTIAAAGGVTINYLSTLTLSIVGQYGVAQLVKTATDTWTLFGAIGG